MKKKLVFGTIALLIALVAAFLISEWARGNKSETLFNEKMSSSFLLQMRNRKLAYEVSNYVKKFQSDYYYLTEEFDKDTCKVTLTAAFKMRNYYDKGIVGYLMMDGKTIFVLSDRSIFYSNPNFLRWYKIDELQNLFLDRFDTTRIVQFRYHVYHSNNIRPVTSFYVINGIKHSKNIKFKPPVITPD